MLKVKQILLAILAIALTNKSHTKNFESKLDITLLNSDSEFNCESPIPSNTLFSPLESLTTKCTRPKTALAETLSAQLPSRLFQDSFETPKSATPKSRLYRKSPETPNSTTPKKYRFDRCNSLDMDYIKRYSTGEVAGKLLKKQRRSSRIPQELQALSVCFSDFLETPKKIDIVMIFEGDGQAHAYLFTSFLKTFEKQLMDKNSKNIYITDCVHHFIGSGSGSIPAALGALNLAGNKKNLQYISGFSTSLLIPGKLCSGIGLFNTAKTITQNVISACSENPQVIDDDSPDFSSLSYDKINISKSQKNINKLLENKCTNDLKAILEIVGAIDSDDISELVTSAIRARNSDAKLQIKRVAIIETVSTLSDIVDTVDSKIGSLADNIKFKLKESDKEKTAESQDKLGGIVDKVRASQNNLVLINVRADTIGDIGTPNIVLTSNADIKYTERGTRNININYRFAVPNDLYNLKKQDETDYYKIITSAVSRAFPTYNQSRRTDNAILTGLTIDFLTQYADMV